MDSFRLRSLLLWGAVFVAGCAAPTAAPNPNIGYDSGGDNDAGNGGGDLAMHGGGDLATLPSGGDMAQVAPGDLATAPGDLAILLAAAGEACNVDGDCESNKCLATFGGLKLCTAPCKAQIDCAGFMNLFCEAKAAGAADGLCIPRSPAHCGSCAVDADCGSLAERCLVAPGDIALACHIDCSLAGADACPADYTCTAVADGMAMRKLCLPNAKVCLDSLGGFCDRVAVPQPCSRTNAAGMCTGQRACIVGSKRFDKCGAAAPQYKLSCMDQDPAGCTELVSPNALTTRQNCGACGKACGGNEDCCGGACASLQSAANCGACGKACANGQDCCAGACTALNTVQNCGACGVACPGQSNTSDALCANAKCDMSCRGDYYDVDKSAQNGCEALDEVPPGHTQQTAASRGSKPCDDGPSSDTFTGHLTSDSRVHNPAVANFNGAIGAAPDYWSVDAAGGAFCVNDYSVTFTTKGGGNTPCYMCTIVTNKMTQSVTTTGAGTQTMSSGSGSYSGGTTIFVKIEKTCNLPVQEQVTYTVSYHL